jgi:hypothetical protein
MAATCDSSLEFSFCDRHIRRYPAHRIIEVATPRETRRCCRLADRADGNERICRSEKIDDAVKGQYCFEITSDLPVCPSSFPLL